MLPYCPLVGIIYIDMYVFVYLNCQALESPKRYAMKAGHSNARVPRSTNTRRERTEVEIHVSSKVLASKARTEVRSAHVTHVGWGWSGARHTCFLDFTF